MTTNKIDEQRTWCRPWFPLAIDMHATDGRREATRHVIDYFFEFRCTIVVWDASSEPAPLRGIIKEETTNA